LRRLYGTRPFGIALPDSIIAFFTLFDKQLVFIRQNDSPPDQKITEHLTSALSTNNLSGERGAPVRSL
jgi:hypothetical protein